MSTIRVGSTEQYADGWENIFGGKKKPARKTAKKAAPKKARPAKKSAKKKTAKRNSGANKKR